MDPSAISISWCSIGLTSYNLDRSSLVFFLFSFLREDRSSLCFISNFTWLFSPRVAARQDWISMNSLLSFKYRC